MPRPDTRRPIGRHPGGFTLIEVLAAFAISAMALTALGLAVTQGLGLSRLGEQTQVALAMARSRLAMVATQEALTPGASEGREGDFAWRVRVAPAGEATVAGPLYQRIDFDARIAAPAPRMALLRIEVAVAWNGPRARREVRLETLRLAARPPQAE